VSPASRPYAWLTVYADVVTLLFTFFVLLISLSVVDARSRSAAVGSVSATFGGARAAAERPAPGSPPGTVAEGASGTGFLYALVAGDTDDALDFQENSSVRIFSVTADALFLPADAVRGRKPEDAQSADFAGRRGTRPGYVLSPRGGELLDTLFPHLLRSGYPVLVAGHGASRRDEEGDAYIADPDDKSADSTWLLSFRRALAVYRRLAELGMPQERLDMAAYGSTRPRFSENSPEGRRKNRRVDLVLDVRDKEHLDRLEALREKDGIKRAMYYRGFRFDLGAPGDAPDTSGDGRGEEER
jgi:chemotaxis protein MotB